MARTSSKRMNGGIMQSFTRVFQIKCLLTMGRQWRSEVMNIFHPLPLSSCCQAYSAVSHTLAGEQHVFLIDASPLFSEKGGMEMRSRVSRALSQWRCSVSAV